MEARLFWKMCPLIAAQPGSSRWKSAKPYISFTHTLTVLLNTPRPGKASRSQFEGLKNRTKLAGKHWFVFDLYLICSQNTGMCAFHRRRDTDFLTKMNNDMLLFLCTYHFTLSHCGAFFSYMIDHASVSLREIPLKAKGTRENGGEIMVPLYSCSFLLPLHRTDPADV